MKLTHIDPSDPESEKRVDKLIKAYQESKLAKAQKKFKVEKQELEKKDVDKHRGYAQSTLKQFFLLIHRNFQNIIREPLK